MILDQSLVATQYTCILQTSLLTGLSSVCLFFISSNRSASIENRKIIENILLAQEVVKDYARDKGKHRCTIRLDIIKAYDSVHSGYVINVLLAMGSPSIFVSWIKSCITSPKYSVKINGIF